MYKAHKLFMIHGKKKKKRGMVEIIYGTKGVGSVHSGL